MKIKIDFTQHSVEELRELENSISNFLYNREDGFEYICQCRSYGRRWTQRLTNELAVNDLCREYDGYDGIVDVYTTNPDAKIQNYGGVNYIKSVEDYEKWKQSNDLIDLIKSPKDSIKKWNERDEVPFQQRPHFSPIFTEQDILDWKNKLESLEFTFEEPISLNKDQDYE